MTIYGTDEEVAAGVIGVGNMGTNHARVYSELQGVSLAAVTDVDDERAREVAREYGARATSREELLDSVDVATVAVPTEYHYETTSECIEADVDVLVEKPFVDRVSRGRELARKARSAGVTIQVGHVERFNPAVRVLSDIVPEMDVVAIDVDRLGPPVDRAITDTAVMDLMIHDIDILLSLVDSPLDSLSAVAHDDRHVTAQFRFEDDSVATLTASRLTQEKVRRMAVTALDSKVNVDFIDQSVEIHRRTLPEYVETNGDIRYRQESVVERPMVKNGEPLKDELASFVESVREGTEPLVTPEDAIRVIEVAREVESAALARTKPGVST